MSEQQSLPSLLGLAEREGGGEQGGKGGRGQGRRGGRSQRRLTLSRADATAGGRGGRGMLGKDMAGEGLGQEWGLEELLWFRSWGLGQRRGHSRACSPVRNRKGHDLGPRALRAWV